MISFDIKRKLLLCIEPLHISDGDMQIGMVDNNFIKNISNHEPYIPGTTLSGNIMQFIYKWAKSHCKNLLYEDIKFFEIESKKEKIDIEMSCYQYLFGSNKEEKEIESLEVHEKAIRINPAKILLMPCMTLKGTKLVSTKERFMEIFKNIALAAFKADELLTHKSNLFDTGKTSWLNLKNLKITASTLLSDNIINDIEDILPNNLKGIGKELIFLSEDIFPHVIAKNLEIRTSVSIDRVTKAGKDGALFTYELVPRGTIFYFDLAISKNSASKYKAPANSILQKDQIEGIWEILNKIKPYFEYLGIGGMTSRGFGKCKLIDIS